MGVHISKWLIARQPFKRLSQISYIQGCRVSTVTYAIYTAAVPEPIQIYTRLPCVHIKSLFTRHSFKTQIGYIHCSQVYPKNCYLHGSRSRVKSAIYIAAGCIQKSLFTWQPFKIQFKINSRLLGVHILCLFT